MRPWLGAAAVFVVAGTLQCLMITAAGGPSPDALRMIALAQEIQSTGIVRGLSRQGSEPIYPLLLAGVHAWRSSLVGPAVDWAFSTQLLAAGGVVVSSVVVYLIVRRLLGPAVGVAAGILFATLPEIARLGADGIADAISLAFVSGSIYCLIHFVDKRTPCRSAGRVWNESAQLKIAWWWANRAAVADAVSRSQGPLPRTHELGQSGGQVSGSKASGVWVFLAGLFAGLAAMSHRAGLILVAVGLLSLLLLSLRLNGTFMGYRGWSACASCDNTQGCQTCVDKGESPPPDQASGVFAQAVVRRGEFIVFDGLWAGKALWAWALGVALTFGLYWLFLGPRSARQCVASLVNDVLTRAPYPNWPKERGPIPAGTHGPQAAEFADPAPATGRQDPAWPGGMGGLVFDRVKDRLLQESFAYRPGPSGPWIERFSRQTAVAIQEMADAFGYVLAIPALVGAFALRRRDRPPDFVLRLLTTVYVVSCTIWAWKFGYIAARHFAPVVIAGIGPAAWVLLQLARPFGRWGGHVAVGVIGCLLSVDAVTAVPNQVAIPCRQVAALLGAEGNEDLWVVDWLGYVGLWSGRPTIALDDLWAYAGCPKVAYVVISQRDIEERTWRGEVLRTLLGTAGDELARFFTPGLAEETGGKCLGWLRWHRLWGRVHLLRPPDQQVVVVYRWDASRWRERADAAVVTLAWKAVQQGVPLASAQELLGLLRGRYIAEAPRPPRLTRGGPPPPASGDFVSPPALFRP